MSDTAGLLRRFIEEFDAGLRPSVADCLAAVHDAGERRALTERIADFLATAPTPPYPEEVIELRDPAVAAAAAALEETMAPGASCATVDAPASEPTD